MTACDLGVLDIHLKATQPSYLSQHLGRAVHAWFFRAVGPEVAAHIHPKSDEGTHREMPFTVSGLLRADSDAAVFGAVAAGDSARVRFTGLDANVVAALDQYRQHINAALNAGARVLADIDHQPWRITTAAWETLTSYQTLIDTHRQAVPPRRMTLRFAAATTFRSNAVNMPLPLPHLVFGSLVTRWQAFTQLQLRELPAEQMDAFIAHHVLLSRHNIQTALYRFKDGGKEVGFAGEATFELARTSAHLLKHNPVLERLLQAEYPWFCRTLGLLADYARFSGVGRKTTAGMGMMR